jgi:hypothetical protein
MEKNLKLKEYLVCFKDSYIKYAKAQKIDKTNDNIIWYNCSGELIIAKIKTYSKEKAIEFVSSSINVNKNNLKVYTLKTSEELTESKSLDPVIILNDSLKTFNKHIEKIANELEETKGFAKFQTEKTAEMAEMQKHIVEQNKSLDLFRNVKKNAINQVREYFGIDEKTSDKLIKKIDSIFLDEEFIENMTDLLSFHLLNTFEDRKIKIEKPVKSENINIGYGIEFNSLKELLDSLDPKHIKEKSVKAESIEIFLDLLSQEIFKSPIVNSIRVKSFNDKYYVLLPAAMPWFFETDHHSAMHCKEIIDDEFKELNQFLFKDDFQFELKEIFLKRNKEE